MQQNIWTLKINNNRNDINSPDNSPETVSFPNFQFRSLH